MADAEVQTKLLRAGATADGHSIRLEHRSAGWVVTEEGRFWQAECFACVIRVQSRQPFEQCYGRLGEALAEFERWTHRRVDANRREPTSTWNQVDSLSRGRRSPFAGVIVLIAAVPSWLVVAVAVLTLIYAQQQLTVVSRPPYAVIDDPVYGGIRQAGFYKEAAGMATMVLVFGTTVALLLTALGFHLLGRKR